ncbi:aspartate dehydrogenase [Pseudorhizobium pelagicum]|uniref:L-aspartate dehydrogenase n=2 Tax=Pseudorhizobium pelagicum TaxID=1509405 RepID=A0A922P2H0_9HYPH|nr:aspartate dehydrogenase [Pseudorhizobium pelagicum]KEQ09138.1 aspartate dehydrogenase [Pseudorhizobium pelagicum]
MKSHKTVSIAGLGAIGLPLARSLDQGRAPGFQLISVNSRDPAKAHAAVADFAAKPRVCISASDLVDADIIIEAAPAAAFLGIARPAISAGKTFIACSAGALMRNIWLVEEAEREGARIIVPSGALIGLDAVRAAAQGHITSCTIETRKSPSGWLGAPYLAENAITLEGLTEAECIFEGNALDAAAGFPANVNVAAALAMAGIGPLNTKVRLIADPAADRNIHHVVVDSDAARFTMTVEGKPSPENSRTGLLTPLSVIACLRSLHETLRVGS